MDKDKPTIEPVNANQIIEELRAFIRLQHETIDQQVKQIETLRRTIDSQAKEIEELKAEIRRLKGLKSKPKIRASRMNKGNEGDGQKILENGLTGRSVLRMAI